MSYLRARSGKSARLSAVNFDRTAVVDVRGLHAEEETARLKEKQRKLPKKKQPKKLPRVKSLQQSRLK